MVRVATATVKILPARKPFSSIALPSFYPLSSSFPGLLIHVYVTSVFLRAANTPRSSSAPGLDVVYATCFSIRAHNTVISGQFEGKMFGNARWPRWNEPDAHFLDSILFPEYTFELGGFWNLWNVGGWNGKVLDYSIFRGEVCVSELC